MIYKKHTYITIAVCIVGFLIPFLLKKETESLNSIISVSFTILQTIITIAALIMALILFDKFGINAKFKERQVEKVLELINILHEKNMYVNTEEFTYIIHIRQYSIIRRNDVPYYKRDANKILLFPENFEEEFKNLFIIRSSEWLPEEIKTKMEFINIFGTHDVDNSMDNTQYVRLSIGNSETVSWSQTFPKITFEMFNSCLLALLQEIESWLKKHSSIPVHLNL